MGHRRTKETPHTDNDWIKSRFEHLQYRIHDALDIIWDAITWSHVIDEQRNLKMYDGLCKEFPYLVTLFEKMDNDNKEDEKREGI